MNEKIKYIVVFATAWGARHGGINAFNIDFCEALARVITPEYQVCCVVPTALESEIREAKDVFNLTLLPLGGGSLADYAAYPVKEKIEKEMSGEVLWWVGHDIHTGPMANLGAEKLGGKSAVFHHMAYWLYNSAKNQDGDQTAFQDGQQRGIAEVCDLFFGIGPLLCMHAKRFKEPENVHEIIPGLQDIKPGKRIDDFFHVIEFGRMGANDDVIKQGRLGVRAFGRAAREILKVPGATPTLTVIGLPEEEGEYLKDLKALDNLVKKEAGKRLTVNPLRYSEDRNKLYKSLSEQDACMMLSWHEGFGLVGWEAIAAEVPLIVSENSGLYKLLNDRHRDLTAYVHHVDIKDSEEDVDFVADHLRWIAYNREKAFEWAAKLKQELLGAGYTWENAAATFAKACGIPIKRGYSFSKRMDGKSPSTISTKTRIAPPDTYFTWLETHCSYAEIDRLQVGGKAIRIDLPEIFVPLYAQAPGFVGSKSGKKKQKRRLPEDESGAMQVLERGQKPQDIEELILKNKVLLIEGQAGSGKTTLLKHYSFERGKAFKRGAKEVPLLVFLKDVKGLFQKEEKENLEPLCAEDILEYYFSEKEKVIGRDDLEVLLEGGQAVLLLDGLDEVSSEQREIIVKAFANLRIHRPEIKVIISSRPHGLEGAAMNFFGKQHIKVLPFNSEQVDTFIIRWFKYIYPRSSGLAHKNAEAMIGEIREHPSIAELIENPLMLTAICILYHDGKELPQQRADLYNRFINNLLYRRFDEPEKVRDFLCNLAFNMQEKGTRTADKDFVVNTMKSIYPRIPEEKEQAYRKRLEALFDEIEPKCGLLKIENDDHLFWHLTFQEFLTAVYLKDNRTDYVQAVKDYWDNERYREVIQLFIGYVSLNSKKWANDVVLSGIKGAPKAPFERWLLAAKSLVDIHEDRKDPGVLSETRGKLMEIIQVSPEPKIAAEAGESLGWLGDPRPLERFIPVAGGVYPLSLGKATIAPFEISQYPVTNRWFERFVIAKGYEGVEFWSPEGKKWLKYTGTQKPLFWDELRWRCPNAPVVGVCWYEADAFCRWLTRERKDGHIYRLPNEQEWEAAAAGKQKRTYPWGDEWDSRFCNNKELKLEKTSSIGIFPKGETPEGIADLAGNVWEWTSTDYHSQSVLKDFLFDQQIEELILSNKFEEYLKKREEKDRQIPVLRGGSWFNSSDGSRCAARYINHPDNRNNIIGFRCART